MVEFFNFDICGNGIFVEYDVVGECFVVDEGNGFFSSYGYVVGVEIKVIIVCFYFYSDSVCGCY